MPGDRRIGPEPTQSRLARSLSSASLLKLLSPRSIHEFMSSCTFSVVWITIVSVHFALGTIRLVTAVTHIVLADPAAYAAVSMVQIPRGVLMATGLSMGAIAMMHFVAAVVDVVRSCKARRLTFTNPLQVARTSVGVVPEGPAALSIHPLRRLGRLPAAAGWFRPCVWLLTRPVDYVLGFDGLFSVNGRFFFSQVNTLETIKVLTQTYQAFQLSQFVYSKPVNSFIVAMIFLNCVLPSTMIYLTQNKRRGTQRLVVVVVDLVLDIIYAEAIPGLVLLPIITEFDWKTRALPPAIGFNDVWANNAVAQTRYVLVISYLDLATTLVPHLNFIMGILLLKKLLHRRSEVHAVVKSCPPTTVGSTTQDAPVQPNRIFRDWRSRVYRGATVCWGIFVVGLHVTAQQQDSALPGCKMPLAPWRLETGKLTACAVMHLNCHRLGYQGDESEIDAILIQLDNDALTTIAFTHCPALQIPSTIVRFSRLIGVEFFNSSLIKWGSEAAVTSQNLRSLHHVFFFATNMTIFPDALAHDALPSSLQYLAVYGSNLAHLPTSLGDVWGVEHDGSHQWRVISIINTAVKELPPSFAKIQIDVLQLIGNQIERLPLEVAQQLGSYQKLRLSGHCFQELPSHIGANQFSDRRRLRQLYVEDSNVSVIPEWLTPWLDAALNGANATELGSPRLERVSFDGSAICALAEYRQYSRFCERDREFDLDAFPYEAITAQWEL